MMAPDELVGYPARKSATDRRFWLRVVSVDQGPRVEQVGSRAEDVDGALDQRQRSVGKLPQSVGVAFRAFVRPAHQQARISKQAAIERRAAFQEGVPEVQRALPQGSRFDLMPGIGVLEVGAERGPSSKPKSSRYWVG